MALPDASTKLRLVLDYLPCEACLAQPVDDQDLLCSICAHLERQVAVRVGTRTTILLEKPSPPEAPVVIPAPAPEPQPEPAPAPLREVIVRFDDEPEATRAGAIEVVVEPLERPAPAAVFPIPAPPELVAAPEPEPAPVPEPEPEPVFDVDDIVTFVSARDEFFDYRTGPAAPRRAEPAPAPEPEPEPAPAPRPLVSEPVAEDDFVFRPPPAEEEPTPEPVPIIEEEIFPSEEIAVEPPREEQERWAPPQRSDDADAQWRPGSTDFLAEDNEPLRQEIVEEEPVELAPMAEEEEVVEMELVEDEPQEAAPSVPPAEEEVLEMEVLPDDEPIEPARVDPTGMGDLYRLRGFSGDAEVALAKVHITEISHLSGHDAGELAGRTGLSFDRLVPWIHAADLVHEVGVPVDAANALVAAGIAGPRGLRDADPDEAADRASAFGGTTVHARDVRRWQRRA